MDVFEKHHETVGLQVEAEHIQDYGFVSLNAAECGSEAEKRTIGGKAFWCVDLDEGFEAQWNRKRS